MRPALIKYPTRNIQTTNRGFTMIELLVATVILAVVSTVSFISVTGFLEKRQLLSATEEITSLLEHTRQLSQTADDNTEHGVRFSPPRQYSQVSLEASSGNYPTRRSFMTPSQVKITLAGGLANPLVFSKREALPNITGVSSLSLETKKFKTTITIDPQGIIESSPIENL